MDLEKIRTHWLFLYFTQKNKHPFVPILTFILGGWTGMLVSPIIGAFLFALSIYFALVIYFPWNKLSLGKSKICREYLVPAIITILIVGPFWSKLVAIFPDTDPYKQPLRTGTATIEVEIISDSNQTSESWGGTGYFVLAKDQNVFLRMGAGYCHTKQVENAVVYRGTFNLDAMDESVGKPISNLAQAEYAQIGFGGIAENNKVVRGLIKCSFNGLVGVDINVTPQAIAHKDCIVIPEIQKYFKKGN